MTSGVLALPVSEIVGLPVLFQAAVMDHAIKKGRWAVVGHVNLEEQSEIVRPKFIQDKLNPDVFSIYEGGTIRAASREECAGLEAAAVWEPDHVEDRVRDYYAGRKNKWVESLKMR